MKLDLQRCRRAHPHEWTQECIGSFVVDDRLPDPPCIRCGRSPDEHEAFGGCYAQQQGPRGPIPPLARSVPCDRRDPSAQPVTTCSVCGVLWDEHPSTAAELREQLESLQRSYDASRKQEQVWRTVADDLRRQREQLEIANETLVHRFRRILGVPSSEELEPHLVRLVAEVERRRRDVLVEPPAE